MPGHGHGGQDAGEQRPGPDHDLVGLGDAARPPGRRLGVGGHQRDPVGCRRCPLTATCPATVPRPASAFSTTGSVVAGRTRPTHAEQQGRLVDPRDQVTAGVHEPGQDQVAQRVARQLPLVEAVLEGGGQRGVLVRQRHQALAEVAQRRRRSAARAGDRCCRRRRPPRRRP